MKNPLRSSFVQRNKYTLLFLGIFVIYCFNLFIDIMDIDAAQYASISMEMSQSGSYLEVYHHGSDYLDKPPLLFWLSSLSISLFGITNFAYKLPSLLLAILGIYSTYRFAKLFYSQKTALFAAIILATSQALFLITNDVRTDTNLLAFVIFAVWQLTSFVRTSSWLNLILGFTGVAFAMMAKGPIGIVAVVAALGTDFLIKKQWKNIFNWKWIVGLVVVAILLAPMTYGLYTQFDLHPEKTAYEIKSPSGVKFFYWTQSFGRITGESSWNNDSGFFFFFHSILWDFQPWIMLLILGLIGSVKSLFVKAKEHLRFEKEYFTLGGFILVFLALSLSKYKLPHYIFVTFPFAAIIAANFLLQLKKGKKALFGVQIFFNSLFWIIMATGSILFFTPPTWLIPILILFFVLWWMILLNKRAIINRLFFATVVTSIAFNLMLAASFYPQLIGNYQGSVTAARMAKEKGLNKDQFYWYSGHEHSLDYYSGYIVPNVQLEGMDRLAPGTWIYTDQMGYDSISFHGFPYRTVEVLEDFPVTQLTLPFLYKETRPETLRKVYILERR